MKNKLLSICEDAIYRKYVSLDPTDRKTLHKYIIKLADCWLENQGEDQQGKLHI
jgi:hypothetical protein